MTSQSLESRRDAGRMALRFTVFAGIFVMNLISPTAWQVTKNVLGTSIFQPMGFHFFLQGPSQNRISFQRHSYKPNPLLPPPMSRKRFKDDMASLAIC
mmetsp:Transcript_35948/g.74728  ORF Transcript_35948/g.74728 Transcript_35948/m.74728 type:complete len:98 (-) Transcript_35948:128-421(-)